MKYGLVGILVLLPSISFAQTPGSLQGLISGTLGFINEVLIPFLLGIAFLIFLINAVRFFVIGGSNSEGQENSKSLALYSIATFVFILAFWGIINLIASGVGLVERPCIDGISLVPDYTESAAPCSSVRPQPRPMVRPDTTGPADNFGSGVDGFPPAGGVVGPNDPLGPGVIIPGNDTPPNPPRTSPTSFTPDGEVFNYQVVKDLAYQTRSRAQGFLSTELPALVGSNAAVVRQNLFSDLSAESTTVSDRSRMVAMLRLERLGELPQYTAQSYYTTLLNYQIDAGMPPNGQIQNFDLMVAESLRPVPLSASAVNQQNQTKQQLITALTQYTSAERAPVLAAEVYDTTATADDRYDRMLDLFFSGGTYPAFLSPTDSTGRLLLERFVSDINTEKIYQGDYDFVR